MARLAGIEPTTPWFVAKYSIQLSYSREASYCIQFFWTLGELTKNFEIFCSPAMLPRADP